MESSNVAAAVRGCLGKRGPEDWPVAFASSDGNVVIRSLKGVSRRQIRAKDANSL